jgi:hypothetical protein
MGPLMRRQNRAFHDREGFTTFFDRKPFAIMKAVPRAQGVCGCRGAWVNAVTWNPAPLLAVLTTGLLMLMKLE